MVAGSVIHYVGAGQIAKADHAECDAQVAGIVAYHERNGYRTGGAYNVHRCIHGGRWLHYLGPNQASGDDWANQNLHAICAVIGDGDDLTPALLEGLYEETTLVAGGRNQITPHSEWFNTSCCGDLLRIWIAAGAQAPGTIPERPDRMNPALFQTPEGVFVYDPNNHTKTHVRTPEALTDIQNLFAISGVNNTIHGNLAAMLADAVNLRAGGGAQSGPLTVALSGTATPV